MSEDELRQEIAVMLFRNDRLTLGQASELAGMNRLAFQRLLSSLEFRCTMTSPISRTTSERSGASIVFDDCQQRFTGLSFPAAGGPRL